ncbi:MAG TPA: hypothetical protein VL131_16150 [Gammaproteobacteria bacterium]|nr:hypothetical protein [Gammaproteobacteria bacterium]
MFKRLRVAFLLYVLLFVAVGEFLAARRSTSWDDTLWVDVYPVNGDQLRSTQQYIDELDGKEFDGIEQFFSAEAKRYGVSLAQPFRLHVVAQYREPLPALETPASMLATLWWSLEMRWVSLKLGWQRTGPKPDIIAFAVFHGAAESAVLDRSTALRKGLIAVTNLFASRDARGSNQMVLAHELLHTLGATDKYSPESTLPRFPDGFADPNAKPLLPQSKAELMAGRIPLDDRHAAIPESLRSVVIGQLTAREIGWLHE